MPMDKPPQKQESGFLESSCLRSNVKSFSNKKRPPNNREILLGVLIALAMIVFGITESQGLLPVINMLVGAFLWMVGYSHH